MKIAIKFIALTLMSIALGTSCTKEGPIGPKGDQGIQRFAGADSDAQGIPGPEGEPGTTGPTGETGMTGPAGANGADGEAGVDCNANVRTFTYDVSAISGARLDQSISALTQDVLETDLILVYLKVPFSTYSIWHPLPGNKINLTVSSQQVYIGINLLPGALVLGFSDMDTMEWTNIMAGDLETLKIVIAEATETTNGKSGKTIRLSKLLSNGVDVSDYYAVMDYYGLEY